MIHPRALAIINEVAQSHGVRPADILGRSHCPIHVRARHEAAWRLRQMAWGQRRPTLVRVGQWLNRDHSTISIALRHYAERLDPLAAAA